MEERNGTGTQEELLLRLQKLYEEREEEFRKREELFVMKEQRLAEKEERLKTQERELKEESERRILEAQILLEEAKNEKLKGQRIKEEYEASAAMTADRKEGGTLKESSPGREEEMRRLCRKQEEELKAKDETIAELRMGIEKLTEEKAGLFRKLLDLPQSGGAPESGTQDRTKEIVPKSGTREIQKEAVPESGTHEEKEELTAGVLYKYLLKNRERGEPKLCHADAGDQVWMEDGGLKYVFAFEEPPYFDIRAKRKNSRALSGGWGKEGLLAEYNRRYPGVTFTYDQSAGEVVASGYFTQEMAPYDLMAKVGELASCFNREEG